MTEIRVATQEELDAALTQEGARVLCVGSGAFLVRDSATVRAGGSATVHAGDSATVHAGGSATVHAGDSATVHAGGSATVHAGGSATVRAWGSATVHAWGSATVRAWESATVHAWDSATVHAGGSATVHAGESATVHAGGSATVRAGGSATVHAWGSATVRAGKLVAVHQHSRHAAIEGGVLIDTRIQTPLEWCEANLVHVVDGVATLYKALKEDYRSPHGVLYTPGSQPEAPDWDDGVAECGGGLHFSPQPFLALSFYSQAVRFVACPVALEDMAVHPEPRFPGKIKARRVCGPIVEVDLDGKPIEQEDPR